jgi:hypothetical protein
LRDPILDPILIDPLGSNRLWDEACKQVLQSNFIEWQLLYEIDWETGNPIYSLYHPATNKSIRIIQNERDKKYGMYMRKGGEDDTIDEIVLCCSLTESTLSVFKLILRVWTRPQTDAAYMNDLLTRCSLWDLES